MSIVLVEEIPENGKFFYRVHKTYCREGRLQPTVFQNKGSGMSCDWEKYSTARDSVNRARIPKDNGIVSFTAHAVQQLHQSVLHRPSNDNRSHSEVIGEKDAEFQVKMSRLIHWEIQIPEMNCT